MEKVQNLATRCIFYRCLGNTPLDRPSSTERNRQLNIQSLECRRKTRDLLMAYKIIFGESSLSSKREEFFNLSSSRTRGNCLTISYQRARLELRHNFFTCRVTRMLEKVLRNGEV